ncbi:hypothetical protein GCM10023331_22660 [Algivirga pacifica]|uniref:Cytochrome c domain-containing protein n=2 Tax=Algivirga pacifica TaxID=1162670 RepID=A0ABP9DE80_9BACT
MVGLLFFTAVISTAYLLRDGGDKPIFSIVLPNGQEEEGIEQYQKKEFFIVKDTSGLGQSLEEEYIKYGYTLINETYKHIGPLADNPDMRYAGNNLACKNCHLDAGQKKFAAPYVGLFGLFPQYRGRENKIGTLEERINGCMERSMNGKKLPKDGKEMKAMVAYMKWLSEGVPTGTKLEGRGFLALQVPDRKADLGKGKEVYAKKCQSCHGQEGKGVSNDIGGYIYPPLWGEDSYNHGAGMHRVLTAARFIKGNMPLGATYEKPLLSDEEAFDVAAYINSHSRPLKENTEKDYPDLSRKPMDSPYPPFADNLSAEQHKYGPFH